MKSFKIISTAWGIAIFSMLLIIFGSVFIIINIFPKGSSIAFALIFIVICLGLYLQRFISQSIIEVALTKDTISVKYLKQAIFYKNPDRIISLNEIKSYKYQEDRNFDLFRLTLLDNTEIDFWHFTFTKDDFENLSLTFPGFIENHNRHIHVSRTNETITNQSQKIEREKTIYENATSPFILVIAFLIIIVISLILIFKKSESGNPFMVLSAITGAVFYIAAYFRYRKKK